MTQVLCLGDVELYMGEIMDIDKGLWFTCWQIVHGWDYGYYWQMSVQVTVELYQFNVDDIDLWFDVVDV